MPVEPITHLEKSIAGEVEPVTHLEQVVAGTTTPVTHLEHVIFANSGGGSATLIEKSVTQNGVYNAADDSADGYSKVTTNVPNSYAAGDEGKVVSGGALVAQSSGTATQNGTVDTTLINSLTVDVRGSGTDYFQYARGLDGMFSISYETTYLFPFEEISINAPLVTSIGKFWSTGAFGTASQKNRGVKKIALNIKKIEALTSTAFNGTPDLEEIVINADNASAFAANKSFLSYLPGLKKISGVTFNGNTVNWTYTTSNAVIYFPTGSALEEIRFVPNSMSYNGTYRLKQHGNLSDDSLVSIANAMDASGSVNVTKTVELHASAAGKLSTIIGTVTDGVFALDTNGTTTLLDFITQTKGWTVS